MVEKLENIIEDGEELVVKIYSTHKAFYKMDAEGNLITHRRKGPAAIRNNGSLKEWYLNGHWHRENGPAIIYSGGYLQYFLNGMQFSKIDYYKRSAKKRIGKLWDGQTKGV